MWRRGATVYSARSQETRLAVLGIVRFAMLNKAESPAFQEGSWNRTPNPPGSNKQYDSGINQFEHFEELWIESHIGDVTAIRGQKRNGAYAAGSRSFSLLPVRSAFWP